MEVEETVAVEMEAGVDIKSIDQGSGNFGWLMARRRFQRWQISEL